MDDPAASTGSTATASSIPTPSSLPPSHSSPNHYCLSIQSHVVHGYVGNRSATFPLQLLGIEVDVLNTVQLATHTGYAGPKLGTRLTVTEAESIYQGLLNHALPSLYSSILTGYIPSSELFQSISEFIRTVRTQYNITTKDSSNSSSSPLVWLCDPVLGDNGKLYMPATMIDYYKTYALPYATILTPNQFEAEVLSGITMKDFSSIHTILDTLHGKGVETVIITSSEAVGTTKESTGGKDYIYLLASCPWSKVTSQWSTTSTTATAGSSTSSYGPSIFTYDDTSSSTHARFGIRIPRIPDVYFTGTGDLIAALILGFSIQYPTNMVLAIEKAVAAVYSVCQRTIQYNNQLRTLTHLDLPASLSSPNSSFASSSAYPFTSTDIEHFRTIVEGSRKFTTDSEVSSSSLVKVPAFMELRLIQSKADIENPPIDTSTQRFLRAEKLTERLFVS